MMLHPMVSIIMPSLNQVKYIGASIDSVLEQSYKNLELIIADGASTDGAIDVIRNRAASDRRVRWTSTKDSGPAQAINFAMKSVRGTVVGWLNSDDIYEKNAIQRAVDALRNKTKLIMVYGHGVHIDENSIPINNYPTLPPDTPISQFHQGCFICQPTVFAYKTLWNLVGSLDENIKTAFDFDYWLRVFKVLQERIGFIDSIQAYSRLHTECITVKMRREVILEGMQVLSRHLGYAPKEWFLTYINESLKTTNKEDYQFLFPIINEDIFIYKKYMHNDDFLYIQKYLHNLQFS